MSFSNETMFEVNTNNIVAIAPLSEGYQLGYENLKDGYFNKPSSLPPIDDMEEYIEDGESEEGFDSEPVSPSRQRFEWALSSSSLLLPSSLSLLFLRRPTHPAPARHGPTNSIGSTR